VRSVSDPSVKSAPNPGRRGVESLEQNMISFAPLCPGVDIQTGQSKRIGTQAGPRSSPRGQRGMPYKSLEELSKAYDRGKMRSIGVFFLSLVAWCVLYGGAFALLVRWTHPLANWMMLPFGLGLMFGGVGFGVFVLYRFNRNRMIRCQKCNSPIAEFDEWDRRHGQVDSICRKCGTSFIQSEDDCDAGRPDHC
jgi:hypothetical protein